MIKQKMMQNEKNSFEQSPEKVMCDSALYDEINNEYDDVLTLQTFSGPDKGGPSTIINKA